MTFSPSSVWLDSLCHMNNFMFWFTESLDDILFWWCFQWIRIICKMTPEQHLGISVIFADSMFRWEILCQHPVCKQMNTFKKVSYPIVAWMSTWNSIFTLKAELFAKWTFVYPSFALDIVRKRLSQYNTRLVSQMTNIMYYQYFRH